jgi:hypothetical protein
MLLTANEFNMDKKTDENTYFPTFSLLRRGDRKPGGPGEELIILAEQQPASCWRCSMPLETVP